MSIRQPKRKSITELTDIFLWEETRKVDKTGCVSLHGNEYEVDWGLCGKKVILRYDPFDLSQIQVWWNETRYPEAKPVDLTRCIERRVESKQDPVPEETGEQLSFLDLAEQKRQAVWKEDPITYARPKKGKGVEEA